MILLWGLPGDGPLRGVLAALQGRREAVYLLDQSKAEATSLDLFVGTSVSGALRIGEDTLALEAIESVYARAYDVRALPAMRDAGPETHLWRHGKAAMPTTSHDHRPTIVTMDFIVTAKLECIRISRTVCDLSRPALSRPLLIAPRASPPRGVGTPDDPAVRNVGLNAPWTLPASRARRGFSLPDLHGE
jgi:hypothetical protein